MRARLMENCSLIEAKRWKPKYSNWLQNPKVNKIKFNVNLETLNWEHDNLTSENLQKLKKFRK